MKTLLICTLYLISGTGSSFEVIGYSGGSVIIQSDLQWSLEDCCGGTKTVNTDLGENVTVECKYPDLFKENDKVFILEHRPFTEIINIGKESQKVQRGRFSISDERSSKF
ncbi:hypothetical protein AOLI_G00234170 [Acnodon oligacanthus]